MSSLPFSWAKLIRWGAGMPPLGADHFEPTFVRVVVNNTYGLEDVEFRKPPQGKCYGCDSSR